MESTNKTIFFNVLSTAILQGLVFFTAPIISRLLGPENYGITTVYTTWVALFVAIFGIQTQSTIAVSRKEFANEQPQYQSSIMFLSLVVYIAFSLLALLLLRPFSQLLGLQKAIVPLLLLQGLGQFAVGFYNMKLTYEFKAKKNFYLSVSIAVLTLGLSILFIRLLPAQSNYWGRIFGLVLPYTGVGVALVVASLKNGKTFYNKTYWQYCVPLCLPIILHSVSGLLLNQSDRIMIQKMMDPASVGIYSLACGFSGVLSTIWTALNNSWVPYYYEFMRQGQVQELKKRGRNYMELFTVLSIGFVLLATEVYHLFAGKEYWPGSGLIPIFAIGIYFVFLYSFPVNYEFYHKKTKLIATGSILAAVCNIVLNVFGILLWGIWGAALATAVAHGLQFLFHYVVAQKISKTSDMPPYKLSMLLPYLAVFSCVVLLCTFTQLHWLIRWGIGGAVGIYELIRILRRKTIF